MALEVEQSLEALLGKGIPQVKDQLQCGNYTSALQVEDALLSRLCPKEHTSLALTCRTALVG